MANELTLNFRLKFFKGEVDIDRKVNADRVTVSGDAYDSKVVSIPTTAGGTALAFSAAIATLGYAFFKNIGDTNYVTIGVRDGSANYIPFMKLKAGEAGQCRLVPGTTYYALADTAAVSLEVLLVED